MAIRPADVPPALARLRIQTGYLCTGHGIPDSRRTNGTRVHGGHELLGKRIPLAAFLLGASLFPTSLGAQDLTVHLDGDYLRVSLPHIDFLQGKPLDRLKDGASVAFIGQLTITTTPNSLRPVARAVARFALSYDIW